MENAIYIVLAVAAAFLIFWLRAFPFTEKKCKEPQQTAHAKVLSRRVQSGNPHRSGRSTQGYTFLVTFELDDGTQLELYAYDVEYGALQEGMEGNLTWKGRYFVELNGSSCAPSKFSPGKEAAI